MSDGASSCRAPFRYKLTDHAVHHHRSVHWHEGLCLRRRLPRRLHPPEKRRTGVRNARRCSTSIPMSASTAAPASRHVRWPRSTTASIPRRRRRKNLIEANAVYRAGDQAAGRTGRGDREEPHVGAPRPDGRRAGRTGSGTRQVRRRVTTNGTRMTTNGKRMGK